jgi:crotonobetainyl-CoA:carnitine CoA-transferase CaiB-like acyl-CoA transferase
MIDLDRAADSRAPLDDLLVVRLGERTATLHCGELLRRLGADVVVPAQHADFGDEVTELLAAADVVLVSTSDTPDQIRVWDGPRPAGQIVCDITAFGHTGPLAGTPASEAIIQARSGCAWITGSPDGPPTLTGVPLLEMEAAVYAAAAVVAAVRVRRIHGIGQRIDMALYDVAVNALAVWIPLPLSGGTARREGNRHPILAPWNVYPADNGWIALCGPTDEQWQRLCAAMGRTELAQDPRFATSEARVRNVARIDSIIASWTRRLPSSQCLDTLTAAGIPNGPILSVADVLSERNLQHRGMIRSAGPHTTAGAPVPGSVLRSLTTDWSPERAAGKTALTRIADRPTTASTERASGSSRCLPGVRPLDGIRVVEIGMNTVAPLAGRQLGALGADVIKIEPPRGDVNRHNGPFSQDGESYIFAISNADKRGLVLDLRDPDDSETMRRLLATADVLLENLKPGSLGRLGLGPDTVRARWPGLIYCSATGFGHDSAYPGRPALDTVIQAMSGVMSSTVVDGVPTKAGISVADQLGGQFALLAILAALELRARTGTGSTIDIAMLDAAAWATQHLWLHPQSTPAPAATIRESAGGWIAEDNYAGTTGPVLDLESVLREPQTAARGLLVEATSPDGRSWPALGSPLRLESTPPVVQVSMPRLGYADRALTDELGGGTRHLGRAV